MNRIGNSGKEMFQCTKCMLTLFSESLILKAKSTLVRDYSKMESFPLLLGLPKSASPKDKAIASHSNPKDKPKLTIELS